MSETQPSPSLLDESIAHIGEIPKGSYTLVNFLWRSGEQDSAVMYVSEVLEEVLFLDMAFHLFPGNPNGLYSARRWRDAVTESWVPHTVTPITATKFKMLWRMYTGGPYAPPSPRPKGLSNSPDPMNWYP